MELAKKCPLFYQKYLMQYKKFNIKRCLIFRVQSQTFNMS